MGLDGDLTAAEARSHGQELFESIAHRTLLPLATVRKRLDGARGNMLVRNIFVDEWPDLVGELKRHTVAQARRLDLSERIAHATGVDARVIKFILDETEGKTLLPNAFATIWPGIGDRDNRDAIVLQFLLNLRVSQVYEYDLFEAIGDVSRVKERHVREQLKEARRNSLVKNVFNYEQNSDAKSAPTDGDEAVDKVDLADRRVSWVRGDDETVAIIAQTTGLSLRAVKQRLDSSNGNSRIRNLFVKEWPDALTSAASIESSAATKVASEDDITLWRVSQALEQRRAGDISKLFGIDIGTVQTRLKEARGNTLIKNLFSVNDTRAPITLPTQPESTTAAKSRIPKLLVEAYREGKLVLFLGSGLSLGSDVKGNLPTWNQIPERLLEACDQYDALEPEEIERKRTSFKGRMRLEQMLSELGTLRTALGRDYQRALNRIFRPADAEAGHAHKAVCNLGVKVILTTNYDQLLESVVENTSRQPYTWKESDRALSELKSGRNVLLKVHGSAERHETVVMSDREYDKARSDETYRAVLSYLLQDHVFLFIGYGMNDPLDLDLAFRGNADSFRSAAQRHYLYLRKPNELDIDRYDRDYNVRVIPYDEHNELPEFLARLATSKTGPL